ncbi:hypothetical protein [Microbacterium sp. CPCC 204701]|uniref:hypothetical protein n=1 Tax=Microbacterium sp. CPCC 204701 TaxID=2493084 RepID=UPI000FD70EBA|nr:hypothetical protein [Microbacterium sp. CPCC 204701]
MHNDATVAAPAADLRSVFADRLKQEHDIIGHRMTWLMTLNGFLVGGGAVLIANKDKFDGSSGLTTTLFAVCLVGALSNMSVLFSNYWATRAIREAGDALAITWATLEPNHRDRQRVEMRLFGRDPASFTGPSRPAPSQPLHPWLFLPGLFVMFYMVIPLFANGISNDDTDLPIWWWIGLAVTLLTLFTWLPVWDARFHNRRSVVAYVVAYTVGKDDDWPRWREQRRLYRQQAVEVRKWIETSPEGSIRDLKASHAGLIPRKTFEKYKCAQARIEELQRPIPSVADERTTTRRWIDRFARIFIGHGQERQ